MGGNEGQEAPHSHSRSSTPHPSPSLLSHPSPWTDPAPVRAPPPGPVGMGRLVGFHGTNTPARVYLCGSSSLSSMVIINHPLG